MKVFTIDGRDYKLPNALNYFQQQMYIHLIEWKWKHITTEPGKDDGIEYDAILPERYASEFRMLYPEIVPAVMEHLQRFPFRIHPYFNHMASSQAANINLFLPILLHREADAILGTVNPNFASLADEHLDHGYRIEFWDEPFGTLGDKNETTGTDSDLAIAYYNHSGDLCLWLIEHKLTESDFTTCGGFKSKGRTPRHDCSRSFSDILKNKSLCYYHDVRKFEYWNFTEANQSFFNHAKMGKCPFQGGINQLWRNQLLGLSVEQDDRQPYKYVSFSVFKHPGNSHLDKTLNAYKSLISNNQRFSVFTSADVLDAAGRFADADLMRWIDWYRLLYKP